MGTLMGMGMSGGGRRNMRRGFGHGGRGGSGGCFTALLVIVLIFIVIGMLNGLGETGRMESLSVTPSTIEREALPRNAADSSAPLLVDNLGWIGSESTLRRGLNDFHAQTGVRPLLYITGNIFGNTSPSLNELRGYAEQRYTEIIGENQAHLLLLFFENDNNDYNMWVTVGNQARAVMDDEAQGILMDYIQLHYYGNLDEDQMFSRAFSQAAERIMKVTTSPWIPVFIVFGIVLAIFIAFMWWKKRAEQKRLEAEETERILNQPLEAFGSDDAASRLAQQYDDNKK